MSILFLKNIENSPKFSGIKLYFAAIRFSAFGTQAVFNVILGERYKTVTKEFKGLVKGSYGKTPAPIDPSSERRFSVTNSLSTAVPQTLSSLSLKS